MLMAGPPQSHASIRIAAAPAVAGPKRATAYQTRLTLHRKRPVRSLLTPETPPSLYESVTAARLGPKLARKERLLGSATASNPVCEAARGTETIQENRKLRSM